jgi:hypothetical protein
MPSFTDEDVDIILAEIRGGTAVSVGGSRCHRDWYYRDGWWASDFDEGPGDEFPVDEAAVRAAIARDPLDFVNLRRAPHLRALRAAWAQIDPTPPAAVPGALRDPALGHLAEAMRWGDPLGQGQVQAAALRWPEEGPTEVEAGLIRGRLQDFTAWHVFMELAGWDQSPAQGRRGVAFIDRLLAMVGHEPRAYGIRASFHELTGDRSAALADLRVELAGTPADAWWRSETEKRIRKLEGGG